MADRILHDEPTATRAKSAEHVLVEVETVRQRRGAWMA
jgi:hypothetical protein